MSWWSDQGGAAHTVLAPPTDAEMQSAESARVPGSAVGAVRAVEDGSTYATQRAALMAQVDVARGYLATYRTQHAADVATMTALEAEGDTTSAEYVAARDSAAVLASLIDDILNGPGTFMAVTIDPDAGMSYAGDEPTLPSLKVSIAALDASEGGTTASAYSLAARAVFPHWDGTTNTLPADGKPDDFDDAEPQSFASWHSSYQAQWLAENPPSGSTGAPFVKTLTIGGTEVHYLLSEDGATVLPINTIELSEIGVLSQADQLALTGSDVWDDIEARLGVVPLTEVSTTSGGVTTLQIDKLTELRDSLDAASSMSADDVETFSKQVDLLEARILAGAIVQQDLVEEAVGEISARFLRVLEFANAPVQGEIAMVLAGIDGGNGPYSSMWTFGAGYNAYSSDDGETVSQGYDEFMRAERAILASKMARASIAPVSGGFKDPRLDVPNLIYRLQSLYETEQDGVADGGTEELLQLYALLDDYALMQQMINETIKSYGGDTENGRRFMGIDGSAGHLTHNLKDPDKGDSEIDAVEYYYAYTDADGVNWVEKISKRTFTAWGMQNWFYSLAADNDDFAAQFTADDFHMVEGGDLSEAQMRVFTMFSNDYFTNPDGSPHPLEEHYGIERPTHRFVDDTSDAEGRLAHYSDKSTWDTYSTQLSDAVTQLNQQVQILQNDIDDATKQKNRHYELGSNALSKMYDMLANIANI